MTSNASRSPFVLAEWAAIAAIIFVWGVNNAAAKLATAVLPPFFVGGVRFAIALVVLIPFLKPPFPPFRQVGPILLLLGPLHFGLIYYGFSIVKNLIEAQGGRVWSRSDASGVSFAFALPSRFAECRLT